MEPLHPLLIWSNNLILISSDLESIENYSNQQKLHVIFYLLELLIFYLILLRVQLFIEYHFYKVNSDHYILIIILYEL